MEEFHKGWLSEPVPVTDRDKGHTVLSPRLCIPEKHGLQQLKYRLIDDLTKSLVNGAVETTETYCPQELDSFVALSRLRTRHGSHQLRDWSLDFSRAYKTISLRPDSSEAAYICFINPGENRPYKSKILAQPPGSRRAPANWGRVVTFIQFLAFRLLQLAVGDFADDVYCTESARLARSGFWPFRKKSRLLGFNTSAKKGQEPAGSITLLGAVVFLSSTAICARASEQRITKLRGHIAQALQLNNLASDSASNLRGRLGFYTSLLMGKLGRCMMSPLIARQYHSRAVKLTRTLRRCLVRRYSAVEALPPRVTPYVLLPPFGAHSDAQGLGRVACRVHLGITSTCHTRLPPWFVKLATEADGESSIYLFEICAAILTVAVVSASHSGSSRSCVLCIDNKAALAALAKGPTPSELGAVLVGVFWALAARSSAHWRMEYVHADSNDADCPTRICNEHAPSACTLHG